MNFLINMDDTLRKGLLLTLFFLSAFFFFSSGSWIAVISMLSFLSLLIYTNGKYAQIYYKKITSAFPTALQKNNYHADDYHLGYDFINGLAINYEDESIAIATRKNRDDEFDITTIPFSSILESEMREDNETLFKTSKGSTIGGALVGGALAGGVGAIVGGMTGSKSGTEKAKRLTLLLVIDDIKNPVYEIDFINDTDGLLKSSPLYEETRSKATKWHKTISVILNKNSLNTNSI